MLDIFTPTIPDEQQHHNFKMLLNDPNGGVRDVITSWTEGFVDRDGKIIKEFQSTFNSAFWEFYLNAAFRELQMDIDLSHARPDFMLQKKYWSIAAEATIASNPRGGRPEWDRPIRYDVTPEQMHHILQLSTIRIAGAITSKLKKYRDEYSSLCHVKGKPFVVCLSPFEQPYFFVQSDTVIRRVLYKFNAPLYTKDKETGLVRIVGEEFVDKVEKSNNSDIGLGFFTDQRMKEVSAIIFSNTATATKAKALSARPYSNTIFVATRYNKKSWDAPYFIKGTGESYRESLLDGLHIFLNPFCEHPFDPDIFYNNDISLHDYDSESGCSLEYVEDGALISHGCISFHEKGTIPRIIPASNDVEYSVHTQAWKEDTLYEINATVGLGVDNHIAHYKGWTVVVFKDKIDDDWFAFAKYKIVYNIQSFILLNEEEGMLSPPKFYENKDAAYCAIKSEIEKKSG